MDGYHILDPVWKAKESTPLGIDHQDPQDHQHPRTPTIVWCLVRNSMYTRYRTTVGVVGCCGPGSPGFHGLGLLIPCLAREALECSLQWFTLRCLAHPPFIDLHYLILLCLTLSFLSVVCLAMSCFSLFLYFFTNDLYY